MRIKRRLSAAQLIEHGTERVYVIRNRGSRTVMLLWAHAEGRSPSNSAIRHLTHRQRDSEVGQARRAIRHQQHVGCLDVPMHDARMMQVLQSSGYWQCR